jgi:hypothetical protein
MNPKKHQFLKAAVHRVRGKVHLLRPREVYETPAGKCRRYVLTDTFRVLSLSLPRNMNDQASPLRPESHIKSLGGVAVLGAELQHRV